MGAVPGVVVDEVPEIADPTVDAKQVERGRSHEEDRADVDPEKTTNLRDRPQRSAYIRTFSRGVVHDCLPAVSSHKHRSSSMFCEKPGTRWPDPSGSPTSPAESRVGQVRSAVTQHPLEPLSADEFRRTGEILSRWACHRHPFASRRSN